MQLYNVYKNTIAWYTKKSGESFCYFCVRVSRENMSNCVCREVPEIFYSSTVSTLMEFSFDLASALIFVIFCAWNESEWEEEEQYKGKTTFRSVRVFVWFLLSFVGECKAKQSKAKHISLLFVIIVVVVFPLVCRWPHFADDAIRNMPHWVSNSIFRSEEIMSQDKTRKKTDKLPQFGSVCVSINRKCNQIIL